MIEKPWRQCAHGTARWTGSPFTSFLPVGPFREGGRIVEVRVVVDASALMTVLWMPFVCGTGAETLENCQAGTPVIGYSNYRLLGVPLVSWTMTKDLQGVAVLPCAIRVVGGAQWVMLFVRHAGSAVVSALCSVVVEGVDRMVDGQGLGVEDGLDK